ncbi:LacI family DNA-binding transcriptional regulator [Phytoactinopolyspora halotolerans]|uniref:LacI family transcriptional regulator n=1 Tax=Phytoactinopolyspora halotolerans TaxID=1981512 RepID=A0A6L9S908_9ACTN|nr:LacI family DNA-binding transcriptional regulator [Phytoactinopolyspora halotolerans]NEE01706.1 LacI family transcriptional regulator [Phytoactinopolyspora halotolerans]
MSNAARRGRVTTRGPAITDVARVAGVSVPTVSRVITGSTPVRAEKRERVLAAIAQLGYRPNGAARALVAGHQKAIAVLTGGTTRYGYASTLQGIEEAARLAGYIVMITVIDSEEPALISSTVDLALAHPVAGVIVLKFDAASVKALHQLPAGLPVVAASGGRSSGVPHAVLDDTAAASQATEYLLSLGHRTVHHVAIPAAGRRSGRVVGWRKALERAGAEVPEVLQSDWDPITGYRLGQQLARRERVTAVLCGNDEIAMGVMRGLHEQGRRVPDDVSVVGFDGHPLAAVATPALTTVEQDFVGLGRRAFDLLAGLVNDQHPPQNSLATPRLVIRESSGPPSVR